MSRWESLPDMIRKLDAPTPAQLLDVLGAIGSHAAGLDGLASKLVDCAFDRVQLLRDADEAEHGDGTLAETNLARDAQQAPEQQRRRFGIVRWFQPETLVQRTRQETAMRAGRLRELPTCFSDFDSQAGDV